jgi:hypothetical protein
MISPMEVYCLLHRDREFRIGSNSVASVEFFQASCASDDHQFPDADSAAAQIIAQLHRLKGMTCRPKGPMVGTFVASWL